MQYIKHENDEYHIIKDGQSYGSYDNLVTAMVVRDTLVKIDWGNRQKYKYIHPLKNGKFKVEKNGCYYGVFKTLEEAIKERDLMVECGWDYDLITTL